MIVHWEARCLAVRTRNGGFKNSLSLGELSPSIQPDPKIEHIE